MSALALIFEKTGWFPRVIGNKVRSHADSTHHLTYTYPMTMFRIALVTLALTLSFYLTAQEPHAYKDPNLAYKAGVEAFDMGLYGRAQALFTEFMATDRPTNMGEAELLRTQAELYYARSAVRLDRPDAQRLILDFIKDNEPGPLAATAKYEIANYYYNAKDYDRAIEFFELVDAANLPEPERTEVYFKQGYSYFVKKKFGRAKQAFKRSTARDTEYYYPANYYDGLTVFYEGDYDEARKSFDIAKENKRYARVVPYYIAQILFAQGKFDEVVSYGKEQLESGERIRNERQINQLVGQALFEQKKYAEALPYLEEAMESGRLRGQDLYQLAYVQYQAGQYQKAIENFEELKGLDNEMGQNALFHLAASYLKLGQKDRARAAFAATSRLTYDRDLEEQALWNYAKLSYELDYYSEAVDAIQRIPTGSRYYDEGQTILSTIFLNTRDYERAMQIIEDMPRQNPKLRETYQRVAYYRGIQLLQNGQLTEATSNLRKSLAVNSDARIQALATYWLADIAYRSEQYDSAIRDFQTFLSLAKNVRNLPDESSVHTAAYNMGYSYLKKKNYPLAGKHFEQAADGISRNRRFITSDYVSKQIYADALLRAGDSYFKRNQYAAAVSNYNEVIKNNFSGFDYALYQSAIIKGLQGEPIDKIVLLERITDNYPNSAYADDALYSLGSTYLELGKFSLAATPLKKLVDRYKGKTDLYNAALLKLGLISYNLNDLNEALDYYKRVFSNQPTAREQRDALSAIEEIYEDRGEPEKYISFLENIPGYNVTDIARDSINYRSARIQFESGNYQRAVQGFTDYLGRFPNGNSVIEAYYNRGQSYAALENYTSALRDYEEVIRRGASRLEHRALRKAAIIVYNQEQDFRKAFQYYARLEEVARDDEERFEAQLGAARAAYRMGEQGSVKQYVDKVLNNPRANAAVKLEANYYAGKMALDARQYDQAQQYFRAIIRLTDEGLADNAKSAEARYQLAFILYQKRELQTALNLSKAALRENAGFPYWVAKTIILQSDIYVDLDAPLDARAGLEYLVENYNGDAALKAEAQRKLDALKAAESSNSRLRPAGDDGELEMEDDN